MATVEGEDASRTETTVSKSIATPCQSLLKQVRVLDKEKRVHQTFTHTTRGKDIATKLGLERQ
jgi:hypothetical protein